MADMAVAIQLCWHDTALPTSTKVQSVSQQCLMCNRVMNALMGEVIMLIERGLNGCYWKQNVRNVD